jgi:hypothetical protein
MKIEYEENSDSKADKALLNTMLQTDNEISKPISELYQTMDWK